MWLESQHFELQWEPFVPLPSSQCVFGCSGPLQRWPAAVPQSVVLSLVEEVRVQCQRHLSDKRSRCLTLTNSLGGLPVSPPSLHQVKVLRLAAAAAKSCALTTHYHSQHTKHPNGSLACICPWWAAASVTCSFAASQDCIFGHWQKRLLWICSSYLSTQRDYCQKLIQTLKLSCLCTVGCDDCNLNRLQKSLERLWFRCFMHSVGLLSTVLPHCCNHTWP